MIIKLPAYPPDVIFSRRVQPQPWNRESSVSMPVHRIFDLSHPHVSPTYLHNCHHATARQAAAVWGECLSRPSLGNIEDHAFVHYGLHVGGCIPSLYTCVLPSSRSLAWVHLACMVFGVGLACRGAPNH